MLKESTFLFVVLIWSLLLPILRVYPYLKSMAKATYPQRTRTIYFSTGRCKINPKRNGIYMASKSLLQSIVKWKCWLSDCRFRWCLTLLECQWTWIETKCHYFNAKDDSGCLSLSLGVFYTGNLVSKPTALPFQVSIDYRLMLTWEINLWNLQNKKSSLL